MPPRPLRIVGSCGEPWDAMTPRGAGRHCRSCDRVVLDLTGMTLAEARAHVERARRETGSACGRAARDVETGELVFAPPAEPPRGLHRAARGALLAAAVATGVAGCETELVSVTHAPVAHLVPLVPSAPPEVTDAGVLPPPPPLVPCAAPPVPEAAEASPRRARRSKHPVVSWPTYDVGFME